LGQREQSVRAVVNFSREFVPPAPQASQVIATGPFTSVVDWRIDETLFDSSKWVFAAAWETGGVIICPGPPEVENLNHRCLHVACDEAISTVSDQTAQLAERLDVVLVDDIKGRRSTNILQARGC
jgi:hypothetical protein